MFAKRIANSQPQETARSQIALKTSKMVQSVLAKPLPFACHAFEDQKSQELNNSSDPQDEALVEVCIQEFWKDSSAGRITPDSSASPQDPITEFATAIDGMQGINNTSVIPQNVTQTFTNTESCQLTPENGTIAGNAVFEPIQGENEVDLESIFDLFIMEDQGKLDAPKKQAIAKKSQVTAVKSQANPRVIDETNHGRWNEDEHCRFLQGVEQYGRQWKRISLIVRTRTAIQVRTHAQKHFLNDPELEELSKRPELRPAKRKRSGGCEGTSSDGTFGTASNFPNIGHWTEREHDLFLQGIQEHGRNWAKVAALVQSRTVLQIRSHAQKHFQKIEELRKRASI